MEALTLDRSVLTEALKMVNEDLDPKGYLALFTVTFPEGINTASTLEICRVLNAPSLENKLHLMKVCIEGKNVEVKCPNGETEKFCLSNIEDNFEGFPLFKKDPLALMAIADNLYGYILKKYVRLSKPEGAAANAE